MQRTSDPDLAFAPLLNELSKLHIEQPCPDTCVSVADFGAECREGFCCTKAFSDALSYCRKHRIGRLIVPKGTYHFITCDQKAHLNMDNMDNFLLDGQGSELVFESFHSYISICNSRQVMIKDLTLDWNWEKEPLASVGLITKIAEDGSFLECRFPACPSVTADMRFSIVTPFDPMRYTPGCPGGMEFRPYENPHIKKTGNLFTDSKMLELVRELSGIFTHRQEKADENSIRFYTSDPSFTLLHFHIGDCFMFRHREYDITAVPICDTRDCTLSNVTLYSAPGSGFVGNGDICGLHFDRCTVTVRPGTLRCISTSADCLHICNSLGHFIIENCEFGYAGDDCINIHDNSSMGIEPLSANTLLAKGVVRESVLFEKGYPVELRNPDLSPTGYTSILTNVVWHPTDRTCELSFCDPLPAGLSPDTVLWNQRFSTRSYLIRRCRFTNNRARGILLQGSDGLVEDNVFENIQGAAIQIETGCESRWSEGHGVKNLILRNNIIRHCDLNAWQMAVLYMGVYLPGGRTDTAVFENILIEHNSFIDCPRQAMFLSSCKNVTVKNNVIINAGQLPPDAPCYGSSGMEKPIYGETYRGLIQFEKASECVETDNLICSFS